MRKNEERTLEAELQLCQEQNHIGEHQREDHIVPDIPFPVNHSTEAQALRLVQALRAGPITTIRAAQELDIVHPPSTVRYLRRKGWGNHDGMGLRANRARPATTPSRLVRAR